MEKPVLYITRILFLAIALTSFSFAVIAQEENSATITGQIVDSTGSVIPNATITVTNTSTGIERKVQSNASGVYNVFPLEPGTYTIAVEQTGFKKTVVTATLNARDRRPVNVTLEVGAQTEVVEVTDEAPLIQESSTGQTLVSGNQVVELPLNNRNFIKLLEITPGVTSDLDDESSFGLTSRASISINGMRRNSVNYLVDGVNNTDVGSNITLLSTPTVDSIKEFKVLSSNYTAEIGRSGGGSVIIVTRGGGKKFSGTLYEFARNDYFNANTFFNNRQGRKADGTPVADTPRLRYNNFGGTFSGPVIIPNFSPDAQSMFKKLENTFFFFSQETRRITRASTTSNILVPSALERQGNLSETLGLPICTTSANAFTTNCTAAGATPLMVIDTNGNSIQARQNMIFRPSDGRAYAGNIIPTSEIDPRSLGLLNAYPMPNVPGTRNGYTFAALNINNTRQEVFRLDHNFTENHKVFGRYTQDTSDTQEPGGLFTGYTVPGITTTDTKVPGKVFAVSYTGFFGQNMVNEVTYNYSANTIDSVLVGRGRKSDYANANLINEVFSENNVNAIPTIQSTRFTNFGALQGFTIAYANHTVRDTFTYTRGNHILKFGGEITWERKDENTGGNTQGTYTFSLIQTRGNFGAVTGTNPTGDAFASFLLGRANAYSEAQTDFGVNFRFGRRELFVQDTWKLRPNLTLDLGVRYQYYIPPYDKFDKIGSFDPTLYDRSKVVCTTPACTAFVLASTDPNNGIGIANSTSRFGRSVMNPDYNNFSPRLGLAWSPTKDGKTVIRAGYGFYYDQALIGIFEVSAFVTPAFSPTVSFQSTDTDVITFNVPNAGNPPGTLANRALGAAISPDFTTPQTQQFSVGIQRELFKNAVIDVSYVGTRGDRLIRARNINFVTPAQTVAAGTANVAAVRPYVGYTNIVMYETAAVSRYHGLLSSFNYRLKNGFTITASYTLSKNMTNSTNDRDAVDQPQNHFDIRPEYAEARTSRRHLFSASYVYELPFFAKSTGFTRAFLAGWQLAGITNFESGAPVPRVTVADTLTGQRGLYPNVTGDPTSGLAGTIDPATGLPFIFDPTVFTPAPNGEFGNSVRSFATLPGRKQTNIAFSKKFYFNTERNMYLQLRAEATNVFNTTQFIGINTTLPSAGPLSNITFGRPTNTRLPREFQFGAKFYF